MQAESVIVSRGTEQQFRRCYTFDIRGAAVLSLIFPEVLSPFARHPGAADQALTLSPQSSRIICTQKKAARIRCGLRVYFRRLSL